MLKIEGGIGNHAVLQHSERLSIKGYAAPKHHICLETANISAAALSRDNGYFEIDIPPIPPSGPFTIKITDIDDGESLTLHDIYTGNVYLICGQSNAAFTLGEAKDVKEDYSDEFIREFTVAETITNNSIEHNEKWRTAEGKSLKYISSLGFHFACRMRKEYPNMAIGIINASYGGTNIQAWISRDSLRKASLTCKMARQYDLKHSEVSKSLPNDILPREKIETEMLEQLYPEPFLNSGVAQLWQTTNFDDSIWESMFLPASWSLSGYNTTGIFWFRCKISLPEKWLNHELKLHLGAIEQQDIVYWNGLRIACTGKGLESGHWEKQRCYIINSKLNKAGVNQLAVRVTSILPGCTNGGFLGPEDNMYLSCEAFPEKKISLAIEWKFKPERLFSKNILEHCRQLGPGEPHSYHMMFDNLIAPLKNHKFTAVIFYQGEANTLVDANEYEELLTLLMTDWKDFFDRNDLPFIIVQLSGFGTPRCYSEHSQWAVIREAQLNAALKNQIPPVVLAENGCKSDIHPPNKSVAGKRLAMTVLALEKKDKFTLSGPVYDYMEKLSNGKLRLYFKVFGSQLVVRGKKLNHLVIAGADKVFYKAESKVDSNNSILVWSESVPRPEKICYCWCDNPADANLYNEFDQPASPFRTDNNRS